MLLASCRLETTVLASRERAAMRLMDFIYATMIFKYSKTRRRNDESTFEVSKVYTSQLDAEEDNSDEEEEDSEHDQSSEEDSEQEEEPEV